METKDSVEFALGVITATITLLKKLNDKETHQDALNLLLDACEIITENMSQNLPRVHHTS